MSKLKSIFNNLLYEESPLVENSSDQPLETEGLSSNSLISKENQQETINPIHMSTVPQETINSSSLSNERDAKYEEQIRNAIKEANQPGNDFFELSSAVSSLMENNPTMGIDNAIKNAFIVLKSGGLTKDIALQTGKIYLNILKTETEKFQNAVLKSSQNKIDIPQSEINILNEQGTKLQNQIRDLEIQMEVNKQQMESKQNEINQAKTKLEVNKRKFHNTINFVESEINELLNHINQLPL